MERLSPASIAIRGILASKNVILKVLELRLKALGMELVIFALSLKALGLNGFFEFLAAALLFGTNLSWILSWMSSFVSDVPGFARI